MGTLRARTDEEFAARKKEILTAAKEQLLTMEYEAVTLATIAKKTSISRTSMYNYYEKKEAVFVDLMIQEYCELEQQLEPLLEKRRSRRQFCKEVTDILWQHEPLLKLLSLQFPIWDNKYDDPIIVYFAKETQQFQKKLKEVIAFNFPDSKNKDRNMFLIQFSMYCNSLYETKYVLRDQMNAMSEMCLFDSIPSAEKICFDGLMKLSADLVKKTTS